VIEDAAHLLAAPAHAKGLELVVAIADDVPSMVSGDPGRLRQVLTNLVGNAIKFTNAGEVTVHVTVVERGDSPLVRVDVVDTGAGMTPEVSAKVFEPFTQADSSTTRLHGGTGLGLTITRQLVELMGGRCGVESEAGAGSRFWFTVRFESATPARPDSSGALVGVTALVVAAGACTGAVVERLLVGWGCDVSVAPPCDMAAGGPFQVAVVDTGVGANRALELARTLAGRGSRVILLTTTGAEVAEFTPVSKPVRRARLHEAVVAALAPADRRPVLRSAAAQGPVPAAGRILLVEDEPVNVQVSTRMLEKGGFVVDLAANGAEAVEAMAAGSYDAVLMDCQMPVMDGYEATARIRAREAAGGRRTPIIAMTASARQEDLDRCIAAGMDDYVSKPVRGSHLLSVVSRWVRKEASPAQAASF
jgi:two-component system sensor histidine kinase/response regulator